MATARFDPAYSSGATGGSKEDAYSGHALPACGSILADGLFTIRLVSLAPSGRLADDPRAA